MINITFFGACDTVTGSCYLLETKDAKILVDCGMFQGGKEQAERNTQPFSFMPHTIDAVLLTHAHIDHSGLLPKLVREGFRGEIIATRATVSLCNLMLKDSAHVQLMEAEWQNRKGKRAGTEDIEPLYTLEDVERCLRHFRGVKYGEHTEVKEGVGVRFQDAGHILGSAMLEVFMMQDGKSQKVVFSGDLGQKGRPIVADPTLIAEADYVVVESTYGNRLHESPQQRREQLKDILLEAIRDNEQVIIPAFAVGRTQDVLYEINALYRSGAIPLIPIYIDSPLAISATEIFQQFKDYYDDDTKDLVKRDMSPFAYPGLRFTREVEESKALNNIAHACVIISASGMAEAGRIRHHLKHHLWRETSHILFVGYQAGGSLGRRIIEGAPTVMLFGEEIAVRAKIHVIDGLSAHADQAGLLGWLRAFGQSPQAVYLTHGEETSREVLAELLRGEMGAQIVVPECDVVYALSGERLGTVPKKGTVEPRAASYDELDSLWRAARTTIHQKLRTGSRREVKEARKFDERLRNLLFQITRKLENLHSR
ncbi:MAG: MBL fold metallo-hydrolase [Thermaerobacter sp.]|nr:MBL fold metallo-hydrolase [Thermaerobacter sp.]